MTRGDTFVKQIVLKKDGELYTPDPDDYIRFAMSKAFKGDAKYQLLLEKRIPNDSLLWVIDHEDTADLDYGSYNYDLEITYASGKVETFLDMRKIELTKEVL